MSLSNESATNLIRQVVRGEIGWDALKQIGVEAVWSDSGVSLSYSGAEVAHPDATDVASGFWRYQYDSDALRKWASIVLAGSAFIDLSGLEGTPAGDSLLDGLWHAADCGELDPAVRHTALRLVSSF